jgi:hypothetical protein
VLTLGLLASTGACRSNDSGQPDAAPATCVPDPLAPQSTWGPPRATMPWKWVPVPRVVPVPPEGDAGAVADAGVEVGAAEAGAFLPCGLIGNGFGMEECSGQVSVRRSGTELVLVFPDGSALHWYATNAPNPVSPPALADGDSPWVRYFGEVRPVCPYCGLYSNRTLEIRARENGPLLWVGREGHTLQDVAEPLIHELFGVPARQQPGCTSAFQTFCFDVTRQTFDHVLETKPPRLLRHAMLERVVSPGGTYDVVWAASTDASKRGNCADGPAVASDTGFAASRVSSP